MLNKIINGISTFQCAEIVSKDKVGYIGESITVEHIEPKWIAPLSKVMPSLLFFNIRFIIFRESHSWGI